MGLFYLFASVLAESAGYAIDRVNFRKNRIGFRQSMFLAFSSMSICLLLYLLFIRQPLPHPTLAALGLVIAIILCSFGGNAFDSLSLKVDDLSLREPLLDLQPVLAGLVAYVIFPDERKVISLIAFVAGALVVRWGIHRTKLRKVQKKGMGYLLLCVVLYAGMPSLYKLSLHYLSPAYIAFFRVLGTFILTAAFLPVKHMCGFTGRRVRYAVASGIVCSAGAIVSLYAIQSYGVVITMLFSMLGPATRYLAGQFILREKVRRIEVLSSLMLTLTVAIAAFMK